MRYRLAGLSLVAVLGVLGVLCWRTALPAGPAEPAKSPSIYALVYVGLGKNDPDNAKRIDDAVKGIRSYGSSAAVRDYPEVKNLAIVKDKDPTVKSSVSIIQGKEQTVTWIERDEWAKSKTRAASVGGTAVILLSFADGSPEEQVAIVNAIAKAYVDLWKGPYGGLLKGMSVDDALKEEERWEADFRAMRAQAGLPVTEEDERVIRRRKEGIKNRPYVIEWAKLPEKP
jgi:hypothetical protein